MILECTRQPYCLLREKQCNCFFVAYSYIMLKNRNGFSVETMLDAVGYVITF
jgi:hypothetical protein